MRTTTPDQRAASKARTIDHKNSRARKYAPVSLDFDALLREVNAPTRERVAR